jgi:hypothetical protein
MSWMISGVVSEVAIHTVMIRNSQSQGHRHRRCVWEYLISLSWPGEMSVEHRSYHSCPYEQRASVALKFSLTLWHTLYMVGAMTEYISSLSRKTAPAVHSRYCGGRPEIIPWCRHQTIFIHQAPTHMLEGCLLCELSLIKS